MSPDPIAVALLVAEILDGAGVEYVVGGSVAAAIHGVPRSTLDIDVVVRLDEGKIDALLWLLGDRYYADRDAVVRAVRERASVSLVHLDSGMRIDLFVPRADDAEQEQMRRRRRIRVATAPDRHLFVYQPEDIVLQKLRWYRMGNEVSDRQWEDVLGVLRVSRDALDRRYLADAAVRIGVADLLEEALAEVNEG